MALPNFVVFLSLNVTLSPAEPLKISVTWRASTNFGSGDGGGHQTCKESASFLTIHQLLRGFAYPGHPGTATRACEERLAGNLDCTEEAMRTHDYGHPGTTARACEESAGVLDGREEAIHTLVALVPPPEALRQLLPPNRPIKLWKCY